MYKVFINQKPVIFTSISQFDNQFINNKNVLVLAGAALSKKNLDIMLDDAQDSLFVVCKDLKKVWKNFTSHFKVIRAGGGLVFNSHGQLLFIHRKGKWDLPKGKLDKGETIAECAEREVMEECGIKQLTVSNKLCDTYHVYIMGNRFVLKHTTWFLMKLKKAQKLKPQAEEDITDIGFYTHADFKKKLRRKTYPLIADIIENLPETMF